MKIRHLQNLIEIQSPAKVNVRLEVLGRRSDGYHELETVMSTVSLFDTISFSPRSDDQLALHPRNQSAADLPTDQGNLILKALHELRTHFGRSELGMDVSVWKRIPSRAGLGGGSSNAVTALEAGNGLWKLNATRDVLHDLAAGLGSDVPFFLYGGTCVCRGRGERVEPVPGMAGTPIVVAMPDACLATPEVFAQFSRGQAPTERPKADRINDDHWVTPRALAAGLYNQLQPAATELCPEINDLSSHFSALRDCLGHQMSGSGTSYFGIFSNARAAWRGARLLASRLPQATIHMCHTLGSSRVRTHRDWIKRSLPCK